MTRILKKSTLYFLLFPIATVLILAAANLGEIEIRVIWFPILFALVFSLIFFLLGWVLVRDLQRASLIAFIFSLFGLTYGHFFNFMKGRTIGNWVIGTHFYSVLIYGLLTLLCLYICIYKIHNLENINLIGNIILLSLIIFNIGNISIYQINREVLAAQNIPSISDTFLSPDPDKPLPDVYFIILDKYARSDALEEYYEYDNSEFIRMLETLGFFVPDCSRSNYAFTVMSLSSQLNMAYVEDLTDSPSLETTRALIKNNVVHSAFEELGYTTIAFEMGFSWGNMTWFDQYYDELPNNIDQWSIDPFMILYMKTTVATFLFEGSSDIGEQITRTDFEEKADRTKLILEVLPEIPYLPGPKFIHAHIITPHPPYLFNPDGSLVPDPEEVDPKIGYKNQLAYIEPRIVDVVRQILRRSKVPPIIIIEGDHGFGKKYVTSNLLALYLPDGGAEGLDDHMTLVNIFPHIFNTYFGTDLDYLPNISYTHTDDWYESILQEEWDPNCWGME